MPLSRLNSLFRHGFVRSVGVLVGGTAGAQILAFAALPLLTRIYSPADFNILAIYSALLAVLSVVACLRLEIAIPLPEKEEEAVDLLVLALACALFFGVALALIVWIFGDPLARLLKQPALAPHLWLLPVGVWLTATYSALQFWATRKKRFSAIARTRFSQAIGGICAQLGLGWLGFAPLGLILGQIFNGAAGISGLSRGILRLDRRGLGRVSLRGMRKTLSSFQRFPKYSALESLANNGGIQLPLIIIGSLSANAEAGFIMLAMRVMLAPMSLIGAAVSQVYISQAPEELRAGRLGEFTAGVLGGMLKAGVGPLIFAGIVSPVIFPLLFGEQWLRAGELVAWMTPWFILQFLASPVSMVLHVTQNQKASLILQLAGIVLRVGSLLVTIRFLPNWIAESYALSGFIFYLIYLVIVIVLAGIGREAAMKQIKSASGIMLSWVVSGIVFRVALSHI